jgi:2-aminoadipate transaminase
MIQDWSSRYAANMRDYEGYSIGKLLGLINDPEVISLAAFQMQRPDYLGVDLESDGIDVERLHDVLSDCRTSGHLPKFIYVMPDFQNPSGASMSLAKREMLLDLSNRFGVPILEDSPYRKLRYQGAMLPSLFSLDQKKGGGRVLGVYTFSKLFCPGMRVGFNIGPPEVIEKMTNIKEGSTLCIPKYNQDMCAAFLTEVDLDAYFERCGVCYGDKLGIFMKAMADYFPPNRGVTWTQPEGGGMFLWVSLPQQVDTRQLFHKALKFKVTFVPGEACYGERPERHHMRVNFSYPSRAQLREAVKRLSDCLEQQGI